MSYWKPLVLSAIAAIAVVLIPSRVAPAQVVIGVGVAPICPYGYFDYAPYYCAPYGYYGPDWFVDGVFLGAGPWFHGPVGFYGHVDNRFDPRHGYHGPLPAHGAQAFDNFHGNEAHDAHGHVVAEPNHSASNEHALPGYRGGAASGHPAASGHSAAGGHSGGGRPR